MELTPSHVNQIQATTYFFSIQLYSCDSKYQPFDPQLCRTGRTSSTHHAVPKMLTLFGAFE